MAISFTPEQLGFLLTHVDEVLLACDAEGRVTFASPSLRELTGHEPAHVTGQSVFDFLHPDDSVDAAERLERWRGRKGATRGPEVRVCTAAGGWREVAVEALTGPDVAPLGSLVLTLRPLTDTVSLEQDLRQRSVNEDRLTRLATGFAGIPSHRVDESVADALAEVGSLEGIDRVLLWRSGEPGRLDCIEQWAAPDLELVPLGLLSTTLQPGGLLARLADRSELHVPLVADSPLPMPEEQELLLAAGVQSVLVVPMVDGGTFAGALGFAAVREPRTFEPYHLSTLRSAAGILTQVLARRDAERELAHQARHDSLTGLGNRWHLVDELRRALTGTGPAGTAVLLIDLDRFKVVNDSLGHTAGDQLLRAVAGRVAGVAAESGDVVARFGGDELVLVVAAVDPAAAVRRARTYQQALRGSFTLGAHDIVVTASIGIAWTDEPDESAEELLRWADAAMYAAKERGRDRIEVFDDELRRSVGERLRRETQLRHALRHDELRVHYQPEFDLDSGEPVAVEALVRWEHPERGLLEAGQFIALAEETAAILDIGPWVLGEACRRLRRWNDAGLRRVLMRVNLSARQVAQPDLVASVVSIVEESGVDPSDLCLEITETTLMAEPELALQVLEKLRGLGVSLAVDDFGTGYSSLAYLRQFPVSTVKIDRTFVDGLGTDPDATAIVRAVIALAGDLGLDVTAEGVETEQQRAELRRLGCRRAQGYLLGRPQPPDAVAALLRPAPANGPSSSR